MNSQGIDKSCLCSLDCNETRHGYWLTVTREMFVIDCSPPI